jgi:hypothetical protein
LNGNILHVDQYHRIWPTSGCRIPSFGYFGFSLT